MADPGSEDVLARVAAAIAARAGADPTESYVVRNASQVEVLSWYRERMPAMGWTPSTDADDAFVIYQTAEGCYGFVAAYENPDGSVDLQISEQSPDTPCEPYVTSPAGHD